MRDRLKVLAFVSIPVLLLLLMFATWVRLSYGAPVVWRFGSVIIGTGANTITLAGGGTGVAPQLTFGGTDTNVGGVIQLQGTTTLNVTNANGTWFRVTGPSAAAANFVEATGELTTVGPGIFAAGSDANINLTLYGNQNSQVLLGTCTDAGKVCNTTAQYGAFVGTTSVVNGMLFTAAATGVAPTLSVGGPSVDATVNLNVKGNGTGYMVAQNGAAVPVVAIASLPSCGAGQEGLIYAVNNGVNAATYNGAVGATGGTHTLVYCNGSGWTYH